MSDFYKQRKRAVEETVEELGKGGQTTLAAKAGVSRMTISNICTGKSGIANDTWNKLFPYVRHNFYKLDSDPCPECGPVHGKSKEQTVTMKADHMTIPTGPGSTVHIHIHGHTINLNVTKDGVGITRELQSPEGEG